MKTKITSPKYTQENIKQHAKCTKLNMQRKQTREKVYPIYSVGEINLDNYPCFSVKLTHKILSHEKIKRVKKYKSRKFARESSCSHPPPLPKTLRLCLIIGKCKEKEKNHMENYFL